MKNKKLLTLMAAAVVSVSLLSGCGNTVENADGGNVVVDESQTAKADDLAEIESVETETEAPTEIEEPTQTEEPEPADWLKSQGIAISPQGDFQCNFYGYDDDYSNPTGDFLADVNVVISETTDGVDEGFKKVSARFTIDGSKGTGNAYLVWVSAFDRYTGTSFEFDSSQTYIQTGDHVTKDGFVTIQAGEEYYDISIAVDEDSQPDILCDTVTVTCPVDYNGTVFQLGYCSAEMVEQSQQIDFSARLYTIDELPFYGDGHYYFTMTND